MGLIESLKWRYATKAFDASKKVSNEDLNQLKESIRLAATSYGLQLFKTLVITDQKIKESLVPLSWGQKQLADCSAVFVLANNTAVTPADIDEVLALKSAVQGVPLEALSGYGDFMKNAICSLPADVQAAWTQKQTYIALGNVLAMAGELKIDACPMEGFEADKYNELLGLTEKGLSAAVVVTVGYRSSEDDTANQAKVRKSAEDLFIHI